MQIRVIYRAQFREAAGCTDEVLELSGDSISVKPLLQKLVDLHPPLQALLLDSAGNQRPSALLFVNDQMASRDAQLSSDDCLTLLSPMAGG